MSTESDHKALTQRIAAEESARFLDTSLGQLDISSCPSLWVASSDDESLPDPRFAPLDDRGVGLGAAALKAGIEEMLHDPATLEEVAHSGGNPELLDNYLSQQAETVSREFMHQNPDYYRSPENWEMIAKTLAFNALGWAEDEASSEEAQEELIRRGHWTLENLNAAYQTLKRTGSLETKPGLPRTLTEHQKRMVAMEAAVGNVEPAICRYLQFRLPEEIADEVMDMFGAEEVIDRLADPELKQIMAEAVYFCWEQSRCEYSPTKERRRALREYVGGRIPTVRLLDAAWAQVQKDESDAMRPGLLQQFESHQTDPSPEELDGLSDEEIDRLYHRTMQKIAKESRTEAASPLRSRPA